MGIFELFVLAVGLSMDAFAVSVCKGLSMKKTSIRGMAICGAWFGGFQAFMPLVGYLLGSLFAQFIVSIDHWIAFGLLALIGVNMIREAFSEDEGEENGDADLSAKTMFIMAVATSIDALAIGITLAMSGTPFSIREGANIWTAMALIGCTTFVLSAVGVKVGGIFGNRFEKKAEVSGGVILILLGIKILLEHLGLIT